MIFVVAAFFNQRLMNPIHGFRRMTGNHGPNGNTRLLRMIRLHSSVIVSDSRFEGLPKCVVAFSQIREESPVAV
jgi:hypothetical protein